jgi:hypothetical protein
MAELEAVAKTRGANFISVGRAEQSKYNSDVIFFAIETVLSSLMRNCC